MAIHPQKLTALAMPNKMFGNCIQESPFEPRFTNFRASTKVYEPVLINSARHLSWFQWDKERRIKQRCWMENGEVMMEDLDTWGTVYDTPESDLL